MASTVALPISEYQYSLFRKTVRLLPGLFLLVAVGWAGKFVEQSITRETPAATGKEIRSSST